MTWQERRTVTILSTILLILFAALLIVLGIRYRENREEPEQSGAEGLPGTVAEEESAYSALTYSNGSTTLSFSLDETGHWKWSDDLDFPLDEATVLALLQELSAWSPQQTLTDADSLENAGLDEPSGGLAATASDGSVATLLFGKTTTDGTSYYVRLNGDESTVYIISDALYKLMCVPIYDMMVLPVLPQLEEDTINTIFVRAGSTDDAENLAPITVITAQHADGGSTTWRYSGANVSDDKLVRDLLEDLTSLQLDKCVIYRPSDEAAAICGFDAPDATLSVGYTLENGEEGTLHLTIGNRLPDGSGRYVRLDDDTTIYLLKTDTLDPLMHISVNGLDG